MMPVSEPLKVRMMTVRALNSRFMVGGRPAQPGEELVVDIIDARMLQRSGKAEIVGEAPSRSIPVRDLADPPPPRR